jgi:UDP-N-acetylglucosamine 2-epimerase (non-hydrolysing)
MKKIMVVFGTRPEVIKMAPIVKALESSADFSVVTCATSQHRSMQDQMVELFQLKIDHDLEIMRANQDLTHITSACISRMKPILEKEMPDMVLVQGDTTTAFVVALAAYYFQIPVGHVEAGLRTNDIYSPFPEEVNRQLLSRIANLHFAPTQVSESNLINENIPVSKISVTGNTVIDALFWMQKHLNIERINDVLDSRVLEVIANQKPYVLITGHRRESFGEGFSSICKAIKRLSQQYPDYYFVYPVHLNPNVREIVYKELGDHHNIVLCDPIDYEPFIYLLEQCKLVLTDSGGIQEEAPSLGKPVLVMREKTERPEGVEAGTAKLVGTHVETIVSEVSSLLDDSSAYLAMANAVNPYGDGLASERTLKAISLSFSPKPVKEQVF